MYQFDWRITGIVKFDKDHDAKDPAAGYAIGFIRIGRTNKEWSVNMTFADVVKLTKYFEVESPERLVGQCLASWRVSMKSILDLLL